MKSPFEIRLECIREAIALAHRNKPAGEAVTAEEVIEIARKFETFIATKPEQPSK